MICIKTHHSLNAELLISYQLENSIQKLTDLSLGIQWQPLVGKQFWIQCTVVYKRYCRCNLLFDERSKAEALTEHNHHTYRQCAKNNLRKVRQVLKKSHHQSKEKGRKDNLCSTSLCRADVCMRGCLPVELCQSLPFQRALLLATGRVLFKSNQLTSNDFNVFVCTYTLTKCNKHAMRQAFQIIIFKCSCVTLWLFE